MPFKLGDRVLWSGAWGAAPPVPGTVTGLGAKHGPLLDVKLDDGRVRWGYLYQFAPIPCGHKRCKFLLRSAQVECSCRHAKKQHRVGGRHGCEECSCIAFVPRWP